MNIINEKTSFALPALRCNGTKQKAVGAEEKTAGNRNRTDWIHG